MTMGFEGVPTGYCLAMARRLVLASRARIERVGHRNDPGIMSPRQWKEYREMQRRAGIAEEAERLRAQRIERDAGALGRLSTPALEVVTKTNDDCRPSWPSVRKVQLVVCSFFEISLVDLVSHRRTAAVVRPRQIAMYLARMITPLSLPQIAGRFGGRDHTTAIHAVRKIDALIKRDAVMNEEVLMLQRLLQPDGGE